MTTTNNITPAFRGPNIVRELHDARTEMANAVLSTLLYCVEKQLQTALAARDDRSLDTLAVVLGVANSVIQSTYATPATRQALKATYEALELLANRQSTEAWWAALAACLAQAKEVAK